MLVKKFRKVLEEIQETQKLEEVWISINIDKGDFHYAEYGKRFAVNKLPII